MTAHPAVSRAAAAIAAVLDTMLAELPKDAVLEEVTTELIYEKLATKPLPTGSATLAKMMGMVCVCCITA
jgi:hypothetical protein